MYDRNYSIFKIYLTFKISKFSLHCNKLPPMQDTSFPYAQHMGLCPMWKSLHLLSPTLAQPMILRYLKINNISCCIESDTSLFFCVKSLSFPYPYRVPALSRHHSSRHLNSSYPFLSKENLSVCYIMHLVSYWWNTTHTDSLYSSFQIHMCALSLSCTLPPLYRINLSLASFQIYSSFTHLLISQWLGISLSTYTPMDWSLVVLVGHG